MIEHYQKPSVKFVVNRANFNKLMSILSFQEENIITEEWKEKVKNIKDTLLRYSIPQKDENGDVAIIDIALFNNEASQLIVLLISAFDVLLQEEEDYTSKMKRK